MCIQNERPAQPGELCTCGRQAVTVFIFPGRETGYCGRPDGVDQSGPCPFCGGERHVVGSCPEYRLRPLLELKVLPRDVGEVVSDPGSTDMSPLGSCCDLALCAAAGRIEELYEATTDPDEQRALRRAHKAVMTPVGEKAVREYTQGMEKFWLGESQEEPPEGSGPGAQP